MDLAIFPDFQTVPGFALEHCCNKVSVKVGWLCGRASNLFPLHTGGEPQFKSGLIKLIEIALN